MKIFHWGDLVGTNELQRVRALFVLGRPMPSAESMTRQAEALFGHHIMQREYVERKHGGYIPIEPVFGDAQPCENQVDNVNLNGAASNGHAEWNANGHAPEHTNGHAAEPYGMHSAAPNGDA
jgi:hypothetical protein